ncbi:MAG: OadG family protein [Bdellovibrio bacteriovorus]
MEPAVADLLIEGTRLMVIGMTIVFAFLLLLVGVLYALSALVALWGPKVEPLVPGPRTADQALRSGALDPRVLAAIAGAVRTHRRRHRP